MGHQFRGNHTFNGNASQLRRRQPQPADVLRAGLGHRRSWPTPASAGRAEPPEQLGPALPRGLAPRDLAFIQTGGGSTCGTVTPTEQRHPGRHGPGRPHDPGPHAVHAHRRRDRRHAGRADLHLGGVRPRREPRRRARQQRRPHGPAVLPLLRPDDEPVAHLPAVQPPRRRCGTRSSGEALPADGRTLSFRLTARDNRAGGGAIGDVTISVVTDAGAGPFVITAPAAASTVLGGSTQTITWDVANTDILDDEGGPDPDRVDVENVQILLLDRRGRDVRTTLLAGTPNDGSADVVIPNTATSQGRFMVAAVGNVFFAVTTFSTTVTPATAGEGGLGGPRRGLSAVAPNPASGTARSRSARRRRRRCRSRSTTRSAARVARRPRRAGRGRAGVLGRRVRSAGGRLRRPRVGRRRGVAALHGRPVTWLRVHRPEGARPAGRAPSSVR